MEEKRREEKRREEKRREEKRREEKEKRREEKRREEIESSKSALLLSMSVMTSLTLFSFVMSDTLASLDEFFSCLMTKLKRKGVADVGKERKGRKGIATAF